MSDFSMSSNAREVAEDFLKARAAIDPAMQAETGPLGQETLTTEQHFTPKGRRSLGASVVGGSRGRGKSLADSIYLKVGKIGFQTRTSKSYANIINSGGTTGPHKILPKRKQALAFNGIVTKGVNHPGGHYRAEHYAEKTIAVMEPRVIQVWTDAVNESIERTLS